ncbi:MAG: hypothetical protein LBC31_11230 [Treponema sp.]|nr:hypothetical protein [Treponema sp.]
MAIKVRGMGRVCAALMMVLGVPVFSQEEVPIPAAAESRAGEFYSYLGEEENGERRFIQHLSWQGAENVRYYEVVIERKEEKGYSEVLRRTTGEPFIEFSFPGGSYRYRVQVYDLLNRPSGDAPWQDFTIITVPPPGTGGFPPETLTKAPAPDFFVSAGYAPLVPLYGNLFDLFDSVDFPGAYARVGFVPFKTDFGSFGFELNPFWDYLAIGRDDYRGTSHLAGIHVNALYQKSLPPKTMFINVRLGGGVTSLLDFHFTYANGASRSMQGFYISAGADISFQWFFFRFFYLEAGLAYRHIITAGEPFQQGYISPFAGVGIEL